MRNIGMVYKLKSTGDKIWMAGWLCKCDAVARLVMVVSTLPLLGWVWFQSHSSPILLSN